MDKVISNAEDQICYQIPQNWIYFLIRFLLLIISNTFH